MAINHNIITLRDAYQTKIDALTDAFDQAESQVALDAWYKAEVTYQDLLEASATSYTTVGRTITKRAIESAEKARNATRTELQGKLGLADGGQTYVDFGGYK